MTTLSFADWNDAQEYYFANGLTDGLPIVPPTQDRVQAMLDYAGVDADHDLGTEIIRQKRFTAGKAADQRCNGRLPAGALSRCHGGAIGNN